MLQMLEELAAGRWQVSRKGYAGSGHRRPSFLPDVWVTPMDDPLGHAACAIGFACLDERFEGLYLDGLEPCTRLPGTARTHARLAKGWEAVAAYFELDQTTARSLFGVERSPASITQVRDWLRAFLYTPTDQPRPDPQAQHCG
ncbi:MULTISPECIES: hypothetical protein [Pseudomonas]|uniref:Uncharacterized protein n=1 Tax=Pseudomonas quercus TaxID=2722792 RepID=A0ABX0YB77_9PSED|nr:MULTISPECIES: hypothetical protein [Pseudomonas]MBF7140826.1 hypothetical protein [Pseudomonas sp. LY10J]NJO99362.1 hypothetical protein [Pseudomonas quercus]